MATQTFDFPSIKEAAEWLGKHCGGLIHPEGGTQHYSWYMAADRGIPLSELTRAWHGSLEVPDPPKPTLGELTPGTQIEICGIRMFKLDNVWSEGRVGFVDREWQLRYVKSDAADFVILPVEWRREAIGWLRLEREQCKTNCNPSGWDAFNEAIEIVKSISVDDWAERPSADMKRDAARENHDRS